MQKLNSETTGTWTGSGLRCRVMIEARNPKFESQPSCEHPQRRFSLARSLFLCGIGFLLSVFCFSAASATPPIVRSLDFNGSYSGVVYYPAQPWMNTNLVHFTVETWVYPRRLAGLQALVARHASTNFWFGLNSNRLQFYRGGPAYLESTNTVPLRRWSHVAATYDGLTARLYINGQPAGQAAMSNVGNGGTNSLSLGGQRDVLTIADLLGQGYPFDGMLDEVRLWLAARSQTQIAAGMLSQFRNDPWLLAAFGDGGSQEEVRGLIGRCAGTPPDQRLSGFGILPAELCVPWTARELTVDGVIEPLQEYAGAETMVLRAGSGGTAYDLPAYLIRSVNAKNNHLFIGIPGLTQGAGGSNPVVQVRASLAPGGNTFGLGDWELRFRENMLQGATRLSPPQPPFYPDPFWASWPQASGNWNGATAGAVGEEFLQNYEFRVHADHLNHFDKYARLLVRYGDLGPGEPELTAPGTGLTNQPATYALANWCGETAALGVPRLFQVGVLRQTPTGPDPDGLTVSAYSGASQTTGILLGRTNINIGDYYYLSLPAVPPNQPVTITYDPPAGALVLLPPVPWSNALVHVSVTNSPVSVTYPPTALTNLAAHSVVWFRYGAYGPVGVTGASPTNLETRVLVRASPLKLQPTNEASRIILSGAGLRENLRVFLRGPGCNLWPPTFCDSDLLECEVQEVATGGDSMTVELPIGCQGNWQVVVEDPSWLAVGGARWHAGPMLSFTLPPWPRLHGFSFYNADDHPSLEEFEACYGNSIFVYTPIPVRNPHYAFWSIIYGAWMEDAKGSCYGMASTARLLANEEISLTTYDSPEADGFHGVRYGNGFLERTGSTNGAPMPARWTGFDLFQPTRPVNLWSRITSFAAVQTSGEGIASSLSQFTPPRPFGAGRGLASGNPNGVLSRVSEQPGEYLLCIHKRDWGAGHCVTPYEVLHEMGLDAGGVSIVPATNRSIIKVYDNNRPDQECFIEVNRAANTFRYNPYGYAVTDPERDEYLGPGLFYAPLSLFRNPRHAPGPDFLAEFGVDSLRMLMVGAQAASLTNAGGSLAQWSRDTLTNYHPSVLPYVPVGYVPGESNRFDTAMLFLPNTNAPTGGGFTSGGSNLMLYAASGWNDIAFGFRAPFTGPGNSVYGILIGLNQALQGMGVRVAEPVEGFSAMTAARDETGASRVWVLDGGPGFAKPDLHLELEGLDGLKLRNSSSEALNLRFGLSGADPTPMQVFSTFELASDALTLPAGSTLRLRPLPGNAGFYRELDANSDGTTELVDLVPARGVLRPGREGGLLALRWRQAAHQETLETADNLESPIWMPADTVISTEGPDRVARVGLEAPKEYFRVRPETASCLVLSEEDVGPRPNPWETTGFKFEALNASGAMQPGNAIVTRGGRAGLDVVHTVRLHPQYDCQVLHLDVFQTSGLVRFEAVGALGTVVSRAELIGPGTEAQRVTLRSFRDRIHYVRVISPNALCHIEAVCWERPAVLLPGVSNASVWSR